MNAPETAPPTFSYIPHLRNLLHQLNEDLLLPPTTARREDLAARVRNLHHTLTQFFDGPSSEPTPAGLPEDQP